VWELLYLSLILKAVLNMDTQKKIALNMGLFLGLTLTLLIALIYAIDLNLFTKSWIGIINVLIITVFGVLSTTQYKKNVGGFINFKTAFTSFFITVLIGFMISTLFNLLLFNVIDVEAKTILSENVIKYTVEMMQKFGAKAADINKVVEDMRASDSFGVAGQLKGFFFNVIFYSIIGLVCSLIIKRVPPQSL
jgi:hypothetical protein